MTAQEQIALELLFDNSSSPPFQEQVFSKALTGSSVDIPGHDVAGIAADIVSNSVANPTDLEAISNLLNTPYGATTTETISDTAYHLGTWDKITCVTAAVIGILVSSTTRNQWHYVSELNVSMSPGEVLYGYYGLIKLKSGSVKASAVTGFSSPLFVGYIV